MATRLTHTSFPPLIAMLDSHTADAYERYTPPLKPVPLSRGELLCVSIRLASTFEATMLGHAARQSRDHVRVIGHGPGGDDHKFQFTAAQDVGATSEAEAASPPSRSASPAAPDDLDTNEMGSSGAVVYDDTDSGDTPRAKKKSGRNKKAKGGGQAWFLPEKCVVPWYLLLLLGSA